MSKLYTFTMPFRGRMEAFVEAESEEEAFAIIRRGDWDDSDEVTYKAEPDKAVLIQVQEIDDTGEIFE